MSSEPWSQKKLAARPRRATRTPSVVSTGAVLLFSLIAAARGDETSAAAARAKAIVERIAVVRDAGSDASGQSRARAAADALSSEGVEILPALLEGMDTPNPISANRLRLVYEAIAERASADNSTKWPTEFLKTFISDSRRRGRPRELALTLLDRLDPPFRAAWIPTRLADPHFRFDAVAAALQAGDAALRDKRDDAAKEAFRKAFLHARDATQVTQAAAKLQALKEPADVATHLGLISVWRLLGPFDAPAKTGFRTVFPPEEKLDLEATYRGQGDVELRWRPHRTKDALCQVNLIEALTNCREAVGFAYAEIEVSKAQTGEVRCGADDNCSIWLNGKKVFAREQWLNGTRFDRFQAPIELVAGKNRLLVKICQGPQHKDPEVPNNWSFQGRLCDTEGRGLEFTPLHQAEK